MTVQETPIDPAKFPKDWFYWQDLFDLIKSPLEYKHSEGPWNGRYFPPLTHRSKTFSFEQLSLRIREIDYAAYMSSVDHIRRALEWSFPFDQTPDDPNFVFLDMWGEWAKLGRGEKFSFAALTHERDREIGCAYLIPPADGDDPYESGLLSWTIEEALVNDLDITLLEEFLPWVEAEWDINSVLFYTPESYQRGLDNAAHLGLQRVDREGPQPNYAVFQWMRP